MTLIQQYQKGKGVDEKGRPPLPSDFNDLHKLAGLEAVRQSFAEGVNLVLNPTTAKNRQSPTNWKHGTKGLRKPTIAVLNLKTWRTP